MPAKGDANSRTTSAVAPGTIDIRENPTQDISEESRSILRPAVIEEHGGEDIQVYQATGEFAEYRVFTKNCLSFVRYIVGSHSEKLNDFNDLSFINP